MLLYGGHNKAWEGHMQRYESEGCAECGSQLVRQTVGGYKAPLNKSPQQDEFSPTGRGRHSTGERRIHVIVVEHRLLGPGHGKLGTIKDVT